MKHALHPAPHASHAFHAFRGDFALNTHLLRITAMASVMLKPLSSGIVIGSGGPFGAEVRSS